MISIEQGIMLSILIGILIGLLWGIRKVIQFEKLLIEINLTTQRMLNRIEKQLRR